MWQGVVWGAFGVAVQVRRSVTAGGSAGAGDWAVFAGHVRGKDPVVAPRAVSSGACGPRAAQLLCAQSGFSVTVRAGLVWTVGWHPFPIGITRP